jgi:putative transposase
MPRQIRLILPEVAVHVIQRGNNRGACFRETSDYLVYLVCLRDLSIKLGCKVHAYCLMTNHVHLLLTPPSAGACTSLMRDLGQRYVQYFNRRHARTGTLWEGRFRSCVAESARYVLACHRYIELNPVRAGMVSSPADYAWSSYTANAGMCAGTLLSSHAESIALGKDSSSRHSAYRRLFEEEMEPSALAEIRAATNGGYPLVSDSLKAAISAATTRKLERGRAGRPPKDQAGEANGSEQTGLFPEIGL